MAAAGRPRRADRPTLLAAAVREVLEETGVAIVTPGDAGEDSGLFDVDVHRIPASATGPRHLHHDLRFRFVAEEPTLAAGAEVLDARWVTLDELAELTRERWMLRPAAGCWSGITPKLAARPEGRPWPRRCDGWWRRSR